MSYQAAFCPASPLLTEARKNTMAMLTSLGFQQVTVTFAGRPASRPVASERTDAIGAMRELG